jgi:hypothetical protein
LSPQGVPRNFALADLGATAHNGGDRSLVLSRPSPVFREDPSPMWATLALTAALTATPAQGGALTLDNIRETYGPFGPKRPDAKILPGDVYVVLYDIKNLQMKGDGQYRYSMSVELLDKDNKSQYKQDPVELINNSHLGGTTVPALATAKTGTDQPPGQYTMKVTVTDLESMKSANFQRKFEVLKPEFGIVRAGLLLFNENGPDAPLVAVVGQNYYFSFGLTGFKKEGKEDEQSPNLDFELRIVDLETGKPTVKNPILGGVKEVKGEFRRASLIPFGVPLNLNRAGKFRIELKATDNVAKKTVELKALELTVYDAK